MKKLQNIGIILHKFNVLLLAEDLRQLISLTELKESPPDTTEIINFLNNENETAQPPSNFCFRDIKKDKDKIISFTENMDLKGPNLGLLLEAILLKKCDKSLNLERLELIGDSLLKLVITIKILNEFPDERKEILSTKRSNIIDNFNLYIRAIEKNIPPYIITDEYQKGNFIPPSYIMKEDFQQFHNKKILSDKDIADVIEAIIGAYLISSGQKAAIRLMNFFNLQPLSDVKNIEITKDFEWPKMVNITGDEDFEIVQETQYQLNKFQNKINHKFNKKTLLYIALSHPHKQEYEKLFYLGEAINDYLITRYIFENNKNIGPGELTNFRDILKSHEYKGFLGLKFEFHLLESEELKEQLHSIKESEQYIFFEVRIIFKFF